MEAVRIGQAPCKPLGQGKALPHHIFHAEFQHIYSQKVVANVVRQVAVCLVYTTEVEKVASLSEGVRLIRVLPVGGSFADEIDKAAAGS